MEFGQHKQAMVWSQRSRMNVYYYLEASNQIWTAEKAAAGRITV